MSGVVRFFTGGGDNKGDDENHENDENLSYDEEEADSTVNPKIEDDLSYGRGDTANDGGDNDEGSLKKPEGDDNSDNANIAEIKKLRSDGQNYVSLLRSQYKKVPTEEDQGKNLVSIAEIESNVSETEFADSSIKASNAPEPKNSSASNYTDVASLRNKYKNILVQSKGSKRKSTTIKKPVDVSDLQRMTLPPLNCQNSVPDNENPTREELYGEGAGLGPSVDPSSIGSSTFRGAAYKRGYTRSLIHTAPYRTDASAQSNKSKSDLSGGSFPEMSIISQLESNSLGDAMAAAAAFVRTGMKSHKSFKAGQRVLIAIPALTEDDSEEEEEEEEDIQPQSKNGQVREFRKPSIAPVNKYGYAAKEGKTELHRQGPFIYVLATVKIVHFKEDARHYTVERADTGGWVRADNGK